MFKIGKPSSYWQLAKISLVIIVIYWGPHSSQSAKPFIGAHDKFLSSCRFALSLLKDNFPLNQKKSSFGGLAYKMRKSVLTKRSITVRSANGFLPPRKVNPHINYWLRLK